MASQTINGKILLRNDTASNWTTKNSVLSKGEMGVEIDTKKFKFGDGTKTWTQLGYAGSIVSASNTNGHINIDGTDTTVYTLPVGGSSIGGVKTTASGAGTVAIDNAGAMELNSSGVTAGDYTKVTVDAHGVVTAGDSLAASDIPTLTLAKISDAGTAASKDTGTSSGNVPVLDTNGKIPTSEIPIGGTNIGGVKNPSTVGTGDVEIASSGTMSVAKVEKAEKWNASITVSATGDATGSVSFDGSANAELALTLANSGVTAGTYPKVTVSAKGLVTSGASLVASDIPTLTLAKISDAGTAASKDVGTSEGNIPVLGANGKLNTSVLPPLAITDVKPVASEAAMLALTDVQKGDFAVRSDNNTVWILADSDASALASWIQVNVPAGSVTSVNSKTGVVTLDTDDISEGSTNLYWTASRFSTAFAASNSTSLADTATLLRNTDTITIDCGNAG